MKLIKSKGSLYINPAHIVFVEQRGVSSIVTMTTGARLEANLSAAKMTGLIELALSGELPDGIAVDFINAPD